MTSVTNAAYDTAIRAHAAIVSPPVKPFLISGVPPPSVVISVRQVGVDAAGQLLFWPINAGSATSRKGFFLPGPVTPQARRVCLLGAPTNMGEGTLDRTLSI